MNSYMVNRMLARSLLLTKIASSLEITNSLNVHSLRKPYTVLVFEVSIILKQPKGLRIYSFGEGRATRPLAGSLDR